MAIQLEAKDFPGVVQLVANSEGWNLQQTDFELDPRFFMTGNPDVVSQTPEDLRETLQLAWRTTKEKRPSDFNGLKVSVDRVSVKDGRLKTEAVLTDYFTAWGIAPTAKELLNRHEQEAVVNRWSEPNSASYNTFLPWAISTHNVLLDGNGDMLVITRAQTQGWYGGKASITEEEQMDPDKDMNPFNASYRSYFEELGFFVSSSTIRLLGVGMEKNVSYISYCFVANTDLVASSIVEKWKKAPDYKDNTNLFAVPLGKIDEWLQGDITPEIWGKYHLAGNLAQDAILGLHPTAPWRVELVKDYLKK